MNVDEAAQRSAIDIDEQSKEQFTDELDDVIDLISKLKDFEPRPNDDQEHTDLRDDNPVTEKYESTSEHRVDNHIRSPKP